MHASLGNTLYLLLTIAFILLFSPTLARLARLPLGACEIILGSLASALHLVGENEYFSLLANVGFYYLMFIAGMEINLKSFFKSKADVLQKGVLYLLFLYVSSFLFVKLFSLPLVFLVIIPVMSVGLLGVLFKDFGKDCVWLNDALIIASLAELVSIIALTITASLAGGGGWWDLIFSILLLLGFLVFCLAGFKLLHVLFWRHPALAVVILPKFDKNEKDIRFCFSIFILIIALMVELRLEIALGAFIAGAFITTFFDHHHELENKLGSLGYGLLIPIFFIHVGTSFDIFLLLNIHILLYAFGLCLLMMGLRLLGSCLFIKKLGKRGVLLFGLSHCMPLTLLIAVATLSLEVNLISKSVYSYLILAAILETIIAFGLIRVLKKD